MNISDFTALLKNSLRAIGITAALTFSAVSAAQEYTVNLKDTDIQEFIKFVADVTGTTMVVDPNVKGKVRVISSKPVSQTELYDLFLSILDVQGYTAVRSGQVIRIVPSKDARSSPVPIMDDQSAVGNDEYVTQVIRLDNISAAKLIPVLRPLVPQQAHLAAYAPSNAIIISDIRSNIGRIVDIIERMDRSAIQTTEIIRLKYGVAEDVVSMLNTLEKSRQGEGADGAADEAHQLAGGVDDLPAGDLGRRRAALAGPRRAHRRAPPRDALRAVLDGQLVRLTSRVLAPA